jgi:hypothetical protein
MRKARMHDTTIAQKPRTTITAIAQCGKLELEVADWTPCVPVGVVELLVCVEVREAEAAEAEAAEAEAAAAEEEEAMTESAKVVSIVEYIKGRSTKEMTSWVEERYARTAVNVGCAI